jgi:hypothetical protein
MVSGLLWLVLASLLQALCLSRPWQAWRSIPASKPLQAIVFNILFYFHRGVSLLPDATSQHSSRRPGVALDATVLLQM